MKSKSEEHHTLTSEKPVGLQETIREFRTNTGFINGRVSVLTVSLLRLVLSVQRTVFDLVLHEQGELERGAPRAVLFTT